MAEAGPDPETPAVVQGLGGLLRGEDPARTRGEAGSRRGGGSAEAPQRLGSGARRGSLEGHLSGTGWNRRERLEGHRGGLVALLHPELVYHVKVKIGQGACAFPFILASTIALKAFSFSKVSLLVNFRVRS